MVWIIVTGSIFFAVFLLLIGKVRLELNWENTNVEMTLRYLLFEKTFSGSSGVKKEKGKTGKGGKGPNLREIISSAPDFFPAIKKFFAMLARFGRISELSVSGEIGTGDPCDTGMLYGFGQSLKGLLSRVVPQFEFELKPNYEREVYDFTGKGKARIRVLSLVFLLLVALSYLPKKLIWSWFKGSFG